VEQNGIPSIPASSFSKAIARLVDASAAD